MTASQREPALRSNRREALVASAFAGYCGWRRSRSVSSTAKSAAAFRAYPKTGLSVNVCLCEIYAG